MIIWKNKNNNNNLFSNYLLNNKTFIGVNIYELNLKVSK